MQEGSREQGKSRYESMSNADLVGEWEMSYSDWDQAMSLEGADSYDEEAVEREYQVMAEIQPLLADRGLWDEKAKKPSKSSVELEGGE